MRYISLFSGIEAASVAWKPLGWEPAAFSEIEPFPCELLKHHYPGVPNEGDVSKVDWSKHGADVVIGGSPCQSFSVAGLRKGLADPRGNLMLEYLRAVDEIRPIWTVWENVPGVLSADGGRAFGTLLGSLAELGYGFAYRVLDAQFFGVAQRRRRVFVVGHTGGWQAPAAVLFESDSLSGNTQTSKEKRKELVGAIKENATSYSIAGNTINREQGSGGNGQGWQRDLSYTLTSTDRHAVLCMADDNGKAAVDKNLSGTLKCGGSAPIVAEGCLIPWDVQSRRVYRETSAWPSLYAGEGGGKGYVLTGETHSVRRLTPLECERLQGFPDNYTQLGDTRDAPRYKALGNSMAVPVIKWLGERIELVSKQED